MSKCLNITISKYIIIILIFTTSLKCLVALPQMRRCYYYYYVSMVINRQFSVWSDIKLLVINKIGMYKRIQCVLA